MTNVVQSVKSWLPLTQNWIHEQVVNLPPHIQTSIIAEERESSGIGTDVPIIVMAEAFPFRWRVERWLKDRELPSFSSCKSKTLRELESRVVHSHFGNLGWFDHKSVAAAGAAHVVTFYGYDLTHLPRGNPEWLVRYRELFNSEVTVLCEGPHMRQEVIGLGAEPSHVRVHHLGVPVHTIPFRPNLWDAGELRVLIAAGFREKKGIPLALDALARLAPGMSLSVDLVGDADRSDRSQLEKEKILEAVERHPFPVRMHGFMSLANLRELIARCHLFLAPSLTAADGDTEGGAPVTLLEAAAAGLPIVASNHCDIPELVLDGVSGLLAQEGDAEDLYGTLQEMISRRHEWSAFVRAGRERIEQEFDSVRQAERLASLYATLAL